MQEIMDGVYRRFCTLEEFRKIANLPIKKIPLEIGYYLVLGGPIFYEGKIVGNQEHFMVWNAKFFTVNAQTKVFVYRHPETLVFSQ